jgi:signal recognition particle subunit SRP54
MFEDLSEKFQGVLKKLRGHGRISEGNVEEALREVRLALLEADVSTSSRSFTTRWRR